MKNFLSFLGVLLVFAFAAASLTAQQMAAKGETKMFAKEATMTKDAMMANEAMTAKAVPTVVRLNQVEGAYTTQQLNLTPGDYIFEVSNTEVDKDLGFYLQDADGTQVSNSGLAELVGNGETSRTGVVTLTEGNFRYSCPLNPTPHYNISVGAPQVIELTQTKGEYVEGDVELAPGFYVFKVTNRNVNKGLGFYLQDADGNQVENSGLEALVNKGQTNTTGLVWLDAGTYQYSCPLNPTPHYTLKLK